MVQRRNPSNPAEPAPLVQQAAGQVPVQGNVGQPQQVVQQAPQQQNVVQPGQVVQPQQPVNVFSGGSGRPTTFENMPTTVGWTPFGNPVNEGSKVQQSWQTMNSKNTEGRMPAAYALNSKPLGGVDLGAVGGDKGVTAVFERDDSQRDGGFFKWLGGLAKKRPGRREGETDEEYDERMTRNNMRIATLADAIRHMGNIYNTMKGGPSQQFNSPAAVYEQQMQQRKAERKSKLAAAAESAYKAAQLQLKMDAVNTYKAYKAMDLELKKDAGRRADESAKALDEYRKGILGIQAGNLQLSEKRFGETVRHNKAQEGFEAARVALARARAASGGDGGSGSGGGPYKISTPYGNMSGKKALSPQQESMAWNEMQRLGMITPKKQAELNRALYGFKYEENGTEKYAKPNTAAASSIIQRAISYGMMDTSNKGDALRKFFTEGFGFRDNRTSSKAMRGVNTNGKKVTTVYKKVSKAETQKIRASRNNNPINWQGSGGKGAAQGGSSGGASTTTDWSKYVK